MKRLHIIAPLIAHALVVLAPLMAEAGFVPVPEGSIPGLVYLDILPVAVIYVPPGDVTKVYQQLTLTSRFGTSTTLSTVQRETDVMQVGLNLVFASWESTQTTDWSYNTTTASYTMSVSSIGWTASGQDFPGLDDKIAFFVNPAFDVTWRIPIDPLKPTLQLTPHQREPDKWIYCVASVRELLGGTGNAQCLNSIVKSPPPPTPGVRIYQPRPELGKKPIPPKSPARRLIDLDVFLSGVATNPYPSATITANPGRFHFREGDAWSPCGDPWDMGGLQVVGQDTSTTSTYTHSSNVQWSLNPTIPAGVTGIGDITPFFIKENDTFTFSYSINRMTSQSTSTDAAGKMYGGSADCGQQGLPEYHTDVYYDTTFGTLLFPTRLATGQSAFGSVQSGSAPAGQRLVMIRQQGGRGRIVAVTDRNGNYRVKLPPGSYTVEPVDGFRRALSQPVSFTVGAPQATPLRLPAIVLGGKSSQPARPGAGAPKVLSK